MTHDLLVLGSGPGGYVAAIRASQLGMKVGIVERENLGGICLNWGCIPTKALLKSAQVYEYLKHVDEYGLKAEGIGRDFTAIIKRSRGVADSMSKGIDFLMKKNKVDVINGTGKLMPDHQIEVTAQDGSTQIYKAKNIIIATGARSRELSAMPIDGKKIIGYRQALTLSEQPKSMIVVGSGAIGTEFAYFYNSMGTQVTIVEYMPNLVPLEDKDVSTQLARSFRKSKINVMTSTEVTSVDTSGDGVKATVKTKKGEEVIEADVLLSAVGIKTNIESIGLEELGIAVDRDKIQVNEYYETNVKGYYAIGDVIPGQALAHVATDEAITCVEKIAGVHTAFVDYKNIPACTYAQPEIASVGLTEAKAREEGYELRIGKFPFTASGKAKAAGTPDGFIKVIFDAKYGELLGCHMIGSGVTDMIAEAVLARQVEVTGHEILKTTHPHPTMSEAFMEAVAEAYDEVIHL